jgi:hypothetical protein
MQRQALQLVHTRRDPVCQSWGRGHERGLEGMFRAITSCSLGAALMVTFHKCETDLPESLRLGRVQVSCEGWSGPGDSHVLKGKQNHQAH